MAENNEFNQEEQESDWQDELAGLKENEEEEVEEEVKEEQGGIANGGEEVVSGDEEEKRKSQFERGQHLSRLAAEKLKKKTVDLAKKKIKQSIVKVTIGNPAFWVAVGYVLLGIFILFVLYFLYYFITNPCEAAKVIGTWWATLLGAACGVAGGGA